ncbi:acyltransferase family protein [Butyrivibrio sp. XBB1001]|uniref:acyltransferase family protein n=1 Tax=Butyrivibrio sp. XBB1001 TaxID=1280682 RepID=UPI000403CA3B|nr:acyltransferase family protein [Butyrivibrio sp. XBB1001]
MNKRLSYIDVFRGLGIIFMMMGHVGIWTEGSYYIHAFNMPMFFAASGFFYDHEKKKYNSFRNFIKNKARAIIIPYFVFGILFYVIDAVIYGAGIEKFLKLFWINTSGLSIVGAIWFLSAIFFVFVIYWGIDHAINNTFVKIVLVLLLFTIGYSIHQFFGIELPWALNQAMVGVLFYFIGDLSFRLQEQRFIKILFNMNYIATFILAIIGGILIFMNEEANIRTENYGIVPLFLINALLGMLVWINISKYIDRFFGKSFIGRFVQSVGRNSIVYLCLNQGIILLLLYIFNRGAIAGTISKAIVLVLSLICIYWLNETVDNTKFRIVFGKRWA